MIQISRQRTGGCFAYVGGRLWVYAASFWLYFTSAKEAVFSSMFVCLAAGLHKNCSTDFQKIWRKGGGTWAEQETTLDFSGSPVVCLIVAVLRHQGALTEVCVRPSAIPVNRLESVVHINIRHTLHGHEFIVRRAPFTKVWTYSCMPRNVADVSRKQHRWVSFRVIDAGRFQAKMRLFVDPRVAHLINLSLQTMRTI